MKVLTDKEIRGAKVKLSSTGKAMKYELVDSTRERGVGRLVVRVSTSGSKEFAYKYKIDGKVSYIQIGRYPSLSLADARERIYPFINDLKNGLNPKRELESKRQNLEQQQRQEAMQGSINDLFHAYTEQMKIDGKRTYRTVLSSLQKEVFPFIDPATKAKCVTKEDIKNILAHMIERGAATQSNRVRSYLMTAFNYALTHDNNPASRVQNISFGIEHNPVSVIPKQKQAENVGNHYLSLDEVQYTLANFINTKKVGHLSYSLLLLCFYTGGQRPFELLASKWESINWDKKTLLITSDISKNKRENIIPLTETALLILKKIHDADIINNGFIFATSRSKTGHALTDSFSTAVTRFVDEHKNIRKFVPRDIRRTCKTLMGELGISKEIRDRIQNHALNDVSSKHYDRYDYLTEKINALLLWETALNDKK